MSKRYNTRLIKGDYSYYVEQIADLCRRDVTTVRRWMRKEGLKRVPKTRPHIVHSSELKRFLGEKNTKRKKPCASNEAFCFTCQEPRIPKINSATVTLLPNGSFRFQARCSVCGGKMNRSIKAAEWSGKHPLATYLSDASDEHSSAQLTHRECPLQGEENHD
jgi:hypothetical protein